MTQGWEEQEQVPEVEEAHGLSQANMPVYLQLAQWLHEQGRWVTLPQVMTAFKLSRAQVYSHLVTLRKRFPNSIEEKRKGRGTFSVMSVRMIAGWSMPTKPVKG
ncbi:hypothetical protein [Aeromonas sp. Y318-1]|uniref:hypothetical protein n=1 Tax=Aeromonas TaxID=642 RepID=UPI0022E04CCC|nr:hypothetical protein [Aeromonas sp. Y318-1]